MIPRIYHNQSLAINSEIELDARATNHVMNVLRAKVYDHVILFNGEGGEFDATITKVAKRSVIVRLNAFNNISRESPLHLHLAQVVSRQEKMDLTIQKSVELGITEITPLISEKCGVKLEADRLDKKLERWQQIIISACEQCGRNLLPTLNPITHFNDFITQHLTGMTFLLDPYSTKTFHDIEKPNEGITLLIGPEGGFSESERMLAKNQAVIAIKFGPRVLRTETAGFSAIAVLQSRFGDL